MLGIVHWLERDRGGLLDEVNKLFVLIDFGPKDMGIMDLMRFKLLWKDGSSQVVKVDQQLARDTIQDPRNLRQF